MNRGATGRRYVVAGAHINLSGDTYSVRVQLKELGARFLSDTKTWRLPHSDEALEVIHGLGFCALEPTLQQAQPAQHDSFTEPTLSVGDLCTLVARSLEFGVPRSFWIVGELIHVQVSRGHTWLELADAGSGAEPVEASETIVVDAHDARAAVTSLKNRPSLSGVIWQGVLGRIVARHTPAGSSPVQLPLEAGLRVRLRGSLSFRSEGSRLLLIVDEVDVSFTQGQLALQRERTLAELRRRGLLDLNKRAPWSPFPFRVALITANQSRARNDFLHELERSGLAFRVFLYDCRMQGEDVAGEVRAAFALIRARVGGGRDSPDVVVLTRGGGSRMDLRWFDDIEIAKAIATCPIPVVSAIGHHDDVSIADIVAARAEKTPTAAAQILVGVSAVQLQGAEDALRRASTRALRVFERERVRLGETLRRVNQMALRRLARERERLDHVQRLLAVSARSLEKVLERGYVLLWDAHRSRILRPDDVLAKRPASLWLEGRAKNGEEVGAAVFLSVRPDYDAVEPDRSEPHGATLPLPAAT